MIYKNGETEHLKSEPSQKIHVENTIDGVQAVVNSMLLFTQRWGGIVEGDLGLPSHRLWFKFCLCYSLHDFGKVAQPLNVQPTSIK